MYGYCTCIFDLSILLHDGGHQHAIDRKCKLGVNRADDACSCRIQKSRFKNNVFSLYRESCTRCHTVGSTDALFRNSVPLNIDFERGICEVKGENSIREAEDQDRTQFAVTGRLPVDLVYVHTYVYSHYLYIWYLVLPAELACSSEKAVIVLYVLKPPCVPVLSNSRKYRAVTPSDRHGISKPDIQHCTVSPQTRYST
jgi:hypothetical protein